ncbi:2-oxoadipate dioxygenase/decarboxylase family protein, partial [Stenotrophomonas sp. SrG]|uniref:2-oxoadipate dioxygenase/decarboxylase family protein n=1 Tax=Stenotrophomonas sp. SrG TaxID=3414430 RepID=UPI003CF319CE
MSADRFVSPDDIRSLCAQARATMYRTEVPLYGTLVDLVAEINDDVLTDNPALAEQLERKDERGRLPQERHGAIRVGTADE